MDIHSDFVISRADGRPMYMQIIEQIKQHIALGDWPPGMELPSIRQLAVALRISVITVKRAYFELERDGVIATQHGKGSVVASANVGPQLWDEELSSHLAHAVRLGALLGLSDDQLTERLRAAADQLAQELS
ncbi:MAG TPA: GntR family transcriptional regulator [Herpetosiphonaceae bacterium]|nr:GntR family transcriptional regulator [Herpetosiphonaceae bacterium]